MVITFIIGKLKDYLMKQLTLLRYLIMKLLHAYSIQFDGGCLKQYQGTILHVGTVNVYIVYDISKSINIIDYPTLEYCLLRAVKLTKNAGIDKYGHYGYRIWFDRHGSFSNWIRKKCNNFWGRYELVTKNK